MLFVFLWEPLETYDGLIKLEEPYLFLFTYLLMYFHNEIKSHTFYHFLFVVPTNAKILQTVGLSSSYDDATNSSEVRLGMYL